MRLSAAACLLAITVPFAAHAQTSQWVGTWAAAPVVGPAKFTVAAPNAPMVTTPPVGTSAPKSPSEDPAVRRDPSEIKPQSVGEPKVVPAPKAAKKTIALGSDDMTIRETIHISRGGKMLRLTLTNEFGDGPLTIGSVHVATHGTADQTIAGTDHVLTFSGKQGVTIAAGQFLASDALTLTLPIYSDLTISILVPKQPLKNITVHNLSMSTTYFAPGDQTASASLHDADKIDHWFLIKDMQVNAEKHSAAVVTVGDSITDGARSTPDSNRRWPDVLSAAFSAEKRVKPVSVLNEGISGNRILHDGTGPALIDRFDRDVLAAPGVKWVILLEGINDIGHTPKPRTPSDVITADQLIDAMKQMIAKCHAKGIKIYGATLTPYLGAGYAAPMGEDIRQAVNKFIRTPGNFDAFIDFEKATEDPNNPGHLNPAFDPGDHLHPNDKGYEAMGNAIPLSLFKQ